MNTTDVENFPGFPEGIMGPELMGHIRTQAERFGAELVHRRRHRRSTSTGPVKTVRTLDGEYTADAVILAMGSAYRKLGLPREDELSGHGVSWCATCDGFFFRDQDIAVVGGGDTAMEEATFLTRFAKSVTVVHRRDALRASRIMVDRAEANPKIRWAWNSEVVDIHGDSVGDGHPAARHRHRRRARPGRRRAVHRHRPRPAQRAGHAARSTSTTRATSLHRRRHAHQPRRRVRRRRRRRPHLPAGHHRRRHRLPGRAGRRALPRRPRRRRLAAAAGRCRASDASGMPTAGPALYPHRSTPRTHTNRR